jgi:hypothetical protein
MISFKGTHFAKDVILYAVFFYVRYGVSYRDLEEIMEERGVNVDPAANSEVSVSYAAKPVVIVFNQGLEEAEFEHAVEALEDSHEAAEYDDTTGILSIPEVEAFGKHYKIQLNNQGDFLFQLIEAHEVSDEDGHVHESGNFCLLANLLMNRGEVTGFRPLPLPNCWISGL